MEDIQSYEALRDYLRNWTNWGRDPYYDVNGALTLMRALVDNLRENDLVDAELAETITPEQAVYLAQLASWAKAHHSNQNS
jgi:hypothetical protein